MTTVSTTSSRIAGIAAAWFLLTACLLLIGSLSYAWSFTDTAFGGYLGFIMPILLCLCCFVAGVICNHYLRSE